MRNSCRAWVMVAFLCKQFSGFFNAFTLKFNVLIPACQQLLSCQEKLVHFEGVGCSFAGDTLRCSWVTELPFFFRTEIPEIPLWCPLDGGTREQSPVSCYPFFLAALQKHHCKWDLCDVQQPALILAGPRRVFSSCTGGNFRHKVFAVGRAGTH